MAINIYVEGGGKATIPHCQVGFRSFLERSGAARGAFKIVACGSRHDAHQRFCIDVETGNRAILLVDSEAAVDSACKSGKPQSWLPWRHLNSLTSDRLIQPNGCNDIDCHLMVQATENWFIPDTKALKNYFGNGFKITSVLKNSNPETVEKEKALEGLKMASSDCKNRYSKGKDTFKLLESICPKKVIKAMPWAARFVDHVKQL